MRSEPMIYCPVLKKVVPISHRKSTPPNPKPARTVQIIQDSMDPVEMIGLPAKLDESGRPVDTWVDSKSRRRQLLKEHNMIELGNETPEFIRRRREERMERGE